MSDDEALTVDLLASEITTKEPMELVLSPVTVFQLVGVLQLARRHPHLAEEATVADAADRFIRAACMYFADCPTVLDVIRRGDDPAEDR